jgi:hypothetical protein
VQEVWVETMSKRKKRKLSALQILQERERKRRLVPNVVIKRRVALATQKDDPALAILSKTKRMSRKHAHMLRSLMLRSMAIVEAPKTVSEMFISDGLEDLKLDDTAVQLINNAYRKISEILIFKMVANELVNDPKLRDQMVDLFLHQRFDGMKQRVPPPIGRLPEERLPNERPAGKRELFEAALQAALGID